ncbi:MAG: hypothetical protein KDC44_13605 [Phaeodactylibacter sp.]|nr:hypothetical protein [Phaeodactylibacter sp.]
MKKQLLLVLCLLFAGAVAAQETIPELDLGTCQLIYEHDDRLIIELNVENGGWKKYYLSKGRTNIRLTDCGKGRGRLCEKYFRICTPVDSSTCDSILLQGKRRYKVEWNEVYGGWVVRQVSP